MNKERFLPRLISALAIIALVVVTNEGYRHYRALADGVSQSKQEIATLKRGLYVLQVQIDNGPTSARIPAAATRASFAAAPPSVTAAYPMPAPLGETLPLPDAAPRTRPKQLVGDDQKSMVSVMLMSDTKVATPTAATDVKPNDGPKIDVQLIGDSK